MATFLTFAFWVLAGLGAGLMAMAALTSLGLMHAVSRFGPMVQDRSAAYAFEAFSQSLLLLFFAYVAYRVRNRLRAEDRFADNGDEPSGFEVEADGVEVRREG